MSTRLIFSPEDEQEVLIRIDQSIKSREFNSDAFIILREKFCHYSILSSLYYFGATPVKSAGEPPLAQSVEVSNG